MSHYIKGPNNGKVMMLVDRENATILPGVAAAKQAFSEGMGVICVAHNGNFEAAAFADCMSQLEYYAKPDGRPRTWLAMDLKRAFELSGFPPERYEGPGGLNDA